MNYSSVKELLSRLDQNKASLEASEDELAQALQFELATGNITIRQGAIRTAIRNLEQKIIAEARAAVEAYTGLTTWGRFKAWWSGTFGLKP